MSSTINCFIVATGCSSDAGACAAVDCDSRHTVMSRPPMIRMSLLQVAAQPYEGSGPVPRSSFTGQIQRFVAVHRDDLALCLFQAIDGDAQVRRVPSSDQL